MSNRAIWDVRKRHVWLSTPLKAKKPKLRARRRCGLQAALQRNAPPQEAAEADQTAES